MPTGDTAVSVVNEALQAIAAQTSISAIDNTTPAGTAAGIIYTPTVNFLLRALDPDFARANATLSLTGSGTTPPPWTYEYIYPATCLRVRQVRPPSGSVDANDPQPCRFNIGYTTVAAVGVKTILTNVQSAMLVFTTSAPLPALWDAAFMDAVVRRLGNYLGMALSGRPDFARQLLEEADRLSAIATEVDDLMVKPS